MKLDPKFQELIAVGASVTANCQPRQQYHSARALESGAGPDEVADAVEVGRTVRKGAAAKCDKLAAAAPCSEGAPRDAGGCCS